MFGPARRIARVHALAVAVAVFGGGCGPAPREVLPELTRALAAHDVEALGRLVHPSYRDVLGGKAELLRDVAELGERFARIEVKESEVSFDEGATRLEVHATGRLDVELTGDVTWRVTGPLAVALVKDDGWQARSGLLDDVRGAMALMAARRAALEANDVEAYVGLLHPAYADGDLDRDGARAKLASDLAGVRIRLRPSLYKLELRGELAHVDEHYVLTVGERELPAAVARFTLRRVAGPWRIAAGLYPSGS